MAKTKAANAETARRPRRGSAQPDISAATQTIPTPAPPPPPPPPVDEDPDLITDEELEDLTDDFEEVTPAQMEQAKADPRTLPRKPRLPETEFFNFVGTYPRGLADNLMFYVYRTEPAIKSKRRDPINGRIITNIDKIANVDQITHSMILNKWGSGKYRVIMTDQGRKGKQTKQICDCVFSINEWDKFPPVFTDPTELVDCNANASLITGLIAARILKRDPTGVLVMHDGSSSTTPGASLDTTSDTVRLVMASHERMMDRMDRQQQQRGSGGKIEEAVAALVLKQVAGETGKPAADPMLTYLMAEMMEARKENRELTMKLIEISAAPRKEANPLSVLGEFAATIKELGAAGLFTGIGGAEKAAGPWWESMAEKMLPIVGPKIADLLTPKPFALPGQTQQQAAPAQSQQQQHQPAAVAPPAASAPVQDSGIPVEHTSQQSPSQQPAAPPAAQADPNEPEPGVIHFLATTASNLLQRNGMSGQDLAHAIFVFHGPAGLLSVKKFPREKIQKLMLAHPQAGPVLEMMKDDFTPFMEELYEYDPAKITDEEDAPATTNNSATAAKAA